MSDLKILHVIPNLTKGGAERLVLNICNELSGREGIKVKLITFQKENAYSFLSGNIDWEVVPAKYTPSIKGKGVLEVVNLQNVIDKFAPDIIHSHLFESEIILSQITSLNSRFFVHFHDNMKQFNKVDFSKGFTKESITNQYERRIVLKAYKKRSPQLISISNDTEMFIKDNLPNTIKSTLLLNAIDTKRFNNSEATSVENNIVNVGSLVKKKGQELAIRTVSELQKRGVKVHLHLLGEGELRTELELLVIKLGLTKLISLHGNVDYPEEFLKNAKLYLHTAIYEPFGLVLIEAMAAGLPVVCTDGKGNRDLIVEEENGFMVWERDPELLADKIEVLLKDKELRDKMGRNACSFAEKFGIEDYVGKLLKIYSDL